MGAGQQKQHKKNAGDVLKTAKWAKMPKASLKALKKDLGLKKKKAQPFKIWGQNVLTFRIFVAIRKCWRIDSMTGYRLGFDYQLVTSRIAPILAVQKLSIIELSTLWEDIDFMEDVALKYWNKHERKQ